MVELFQFLQLLEIEEKGRKSPVGTSVGGRPGMHRQTCCIKEWILGLCLPKWFQHRGKSKLVTTQETTVCSALDIASLGGRPCLHCLTLQFVESNILSLPTRVVQHPRRLRLDFPLDKICPVTNPKGKKLIGLKKTEICHLQGKYN